MANKSNNKKNNNKKDTCYIIGDIIIIILLVLVIFFIINKKNTNKDKDNKEDNTVVTDNNVNNDNKVIKDENKEKLDYLNNINEKIDFFKDEYLDRYVNYKKENPDLDDEMVVVYVNIGLDKTFYEDITDSPNKFTTTVLANKLYYLGEDYVPKNLEKIKSSYSSGDKYMESVARIAFEEMAKNAEKEGYNIRAVSTYRSYSYQKNLYNNYASQDGKQKADTYSARPGFSEHQTGLAVDVDNTKTSYTKFGNTKEFTWMKENAYKYGFILRYTKENEFITGYINEPWHYRYVGLEIAKYIQENPMTYEEYYVRFLDK